MDEEGLLPKAYAAHFLGISVRTLEKWMHEKRIFYVYGPGKTYKRALFKQADLEVLKKEIAPSLYPQRNNSRPQSRQKRRRCEELHALIDSQARKIKRIRSAFEAVLNASGFSERQIKHFMDEYLWKEE